MGQVLYVADTLTQFGKQLGLKGVGMSELQGILDAAAAGAAVGGAVGDGSDAKAVREALAWLACTYQGLLKVCVFGAVKQIGQREGFFLGGGGGAT